MDIFEPSVSHKFLVTFFFSGIPSPLDFKFQRVTGLTRELQTTAFREGGENARNLYFAEQVQHGSLILERGVMTLTPLTFVFDEILSGKNTYYATASIILLNSHSLPVCSWTVTNALPVSWKTSDLDANSNSVLINTLELRYQNMIWLGVKA